MNRISFLSFSWIVLLIAMLMPPLCTRGEDSWSGLYYYPDAVIGQGDYSQGAPDRVVWIGL